MPVTSLDTLLASSIMICLVLASMASVFAAIQPFLKDQVSHHEVEANLSLAEYLLIEAGISASWGSNINESLVIFGLANQDSPVPFELNIDKVTRLNEKNIYNLSFLEAFNSLNTKDKPFRIIIKPLFNIAVNLVSREENDSAITYRFNILAERSNFPVKAALKCYAVIKDYVVSCSSQTSSLGEGLIEFSLPKSLSGTALLIVFAETEPKMLSYTVHRFAHNSLNPPSSEGRYALLSPLNYTLRADLNSSNRILHAMIFTYNYVFNLTETEGDSTIQYFIIPKILDESIMILVGTGLNASSSECFAEWVSYPQIPLDFGLGFTSKYQLADSFSFRFLVTINSAIYECEVILWRS